MKFDRTVVFGDFHGDLDIVLASLSEQGLVRYDCELDEIAEQIKAYLNESFAPSLEAMVIPQAQPVRVVFLGDLLDRYHFGYHIIQFIEKIRWEIFEIYPIFLLGNHDLLNVHFFLNPFKVSDIYQGCGHSKSETVSYINRMGIDKSLESFKALHDDEMVKMQAMFYETGTLQYQEAGYTLQYQYPCDLSPLAKYHLSSDGYTGYYNKIVTELELDSEKRLEEGTIKWPSGLAHVLFNLLGEKTAKKEPRNWWDISHTPDDEEEDYRWGKVSNFNLFTKEGDEDNVEVFPVDWRVISLIWRHHYGNFFRRTRLLHSEGTTLFVHGGISPLAMLDPLAFGNIYDPRHDKFKPLRAEYKRDLSLEKLITRSNRLVTQIMENALNDYSFRRMNGAEVVDQMGYWRGVAEGYPAFGGPIWSDFGYIQQNVGEHERLMQLYRAFKEATNIERIICGHTHFHIMDKPEIRFLSMSELKEAIGLEYLCVDNACSRGYRQEPVLNGIEIDREGNIHAPGEVGSSSMLW